MQQLEARVRRLEYEEHRAHRLADMAERKKQEMFQARQRHQEDMLEKKRQTAARLSYLSL